MRDILNQAENLWYTTWINEGKKDEGTCTLGNCIKTPYGKVDAPPAQGNVTKYQTAQPVLQFLADNGIIGTYYDGRMD